MGQVAKLSDRIINQIAAGEVVERPVAVVKELVENALDAGATRIEIVFEKGGKALIRIADNGSGMDSEDAELAVERHATSKIKHVDDILKISSFGFRGEALPSIASVSRFSLRTRQIEDPQGIEIRINGGKAKQVQTCGMSPGTTIEVAQLFNSVPARRKFLKTDRTEAAHIIQMSRLLAIANPKVAFVLIEDGREVFNSPVCERLEDRVAEIYGRQRARELMPFSANSETIRLRGLISKTGTSRATRAEMITFVNGRPVDSRLINYALIESYHSYLPRGRYPVSFLFLDVKPDQVDVNVHPSKREVRFRDEGLVRQFIMEKLIAKLREETGKSLQNAERVVPVQRPSGSQNASVPFSLEKENQASRPGGKEGAVPAPSIQPPSIPSGSEAINNAILPSPAKKSWQLIGIFQETLGLFDSGDGLVLVDGKRAQKRIQFETILKDLDNENVHQQDHLIPPLLELEPVKASALNDHLEFFKRIGYSVERFGGHSFRLRSYPSWLNDKLAESLLKDLVDKIAERGLRPNDFEPAKELIAKLTIRRMRFIATNNWGELLNKLLACENPLTDAEGLKTLIRFSMNDLEQHFRK